MSVPTSAIYPHLVAALNGRPWAIHEPTLNVILEIMSGRLAGMKFDVDEIAARVGAARAEQGPRRGQQRTKSVAVIPIYGTIMPRGGMMADSSGGTSAESIRRDFRSVLEDDDVEAIAFDIDSPGGVVDGLPELFAEIYSARGQKPMTAVANTMAASGALWLGAAADRFVVTPSGTVGSIGVIAAHHDRSGAYEKQGVKTTLIKSSKFKGEGSDIGPLSDEALANIQDEVNHYDAMFTGDVARGRGVDDKKVREDFGQGRTLNAQKAVKAGLVDGIQTLEGAVYDLSVGAVSAGSAQMAAAADHQHLVAADATVVSLQSQGESIPFSDRLRLVTAELEEVVGIARDRQARRAEEGRPLSAETREHLARIIATAEELVTVTPQVSEPQRVASVEVLHLMLRTYEE